MTVSYHAVCNLNAVKSEMIEMLRTMWRIAVGVTVRFVEENPVVSENSSSVTICVERLGSSAEDITLMVRAQESNPPDARGMVLVLLGRAFWTSFSQFTSLTCIAAFMIPF